MLRYADKEPDTTLDTLLIGAVGLALSSGYVPPSFLPVLGTGATAAVSHLAKENFSYSSRSARRKLSTSVIRRSQIRLRQDVSLYKTVILLYGALASLLQKCAAGDILTTKTQPKSDDNDDDSLGVTRQLAFLRGLCQNAGDQDFEEVDDRQRFDPFPRKLKSPRHAVAALIFVFGQWQKAFINYANQGVFDLVFGGSDCYYISEIIRAAATDAIWRSPEWKADVLCGQLCLLFLAVLDSLINVDPTDVVSSGLSACVTTETSDGAANPFAGLLFHTRVKRALRVVKHLLSLSAPANVEDPDKRSGSPDFSLSSDLSYSQVAGDSYPGAKPLSGASDLQMHSGPERSQLSILLSSLSGSNSVIDAEQLTAKGRELADDERYLTRYWGQKKHSPSDLLLKLCWITPLPDSPMVVRNWSPKAIGVRVYSMSDSPLRKRDGYGISSFMNTLFDPVPVAQTKLAKNSEWVFRPKTTSAAIRESGRRNRRRKVKAIGGIDKISAEDSDNERSDEEDYPGHHRVQKKSQTVTEYVETSWNPLDISEDDVRFDIVVFSMDGVVLDENTIYRGQVYEFDVARPPKPPKSLQQYRPTHVDEKPNLQSVEKLLSDGSVDLNQPHEHLSPSKVHTNRRICLPADEMLCKFRNLPEFTLCTRCMRRMEPQFGCRKRQLGGDYVEGVDCDGCGKERIDLKDPGDEASKADGRASGNKQRPGSRYEQENDQPYFHCARCNYDLCKACAIHTLKKDWWK